MSRGLQRERDLVNLLREDGYWAMRSPASKGVADVVAIKWCPPVMDWAKITIPGHHVIRFIEVKSTAAGPYSHFGPADRAALVAEADKAGALAELCWWPPRKKPKFIPDHDWP